jgi:chromosome partitioning protein
VNQKVVCVINLKGGVGKSTIAALLARYAFNWRKADVLAIDLDPQANLSQALMGPRYSDFLREKRPSIVEVFNGYLPANTSSGPRLIGSDDAVETIHQNSGKSLQLIPSRFDFSDQLTKSLQPDPRVLARFIADKFNHKNLVLIDCSPTESILSHAAYHASSGVLVPVKPEYFATVGFPLLNESLSKFKSNNRSSNIGVIGVVINNPFYDGGNDGGPEKRRSINEIEIECAKNGWKIFDKEIPFSRGFPKIMRGDYNHSGNAYQFNAFAAEFFREIGV